MVHWYIFIQIWFLSFTTFNDGRARILIGWPPGSWRSYMLMKNREINNSMLKIHNNADVLTLLRTYIHIHTHILIYSYIHINALLSRGTPVMFGELHVNIRARVWWLIYYHWYEQHAAKKASCPVIQIPISYVHTHTLNSLAPGRS